MLWYRGIIKLLGCATALCFLLVLGAPPPNAQAETFPTYQDYNFSPARTRHVSFYTGSVGTVTFYAYITPGEKLSYSFQLMDSEMSFSTNDQITVTVNGPSSSFSDVQICNYPTTCAWTSSPVPPGGAAGIWRITVTKVGPNLGRFAPWHISVIDDATGSEKTGRVYAETIRMSQLGNVRGDLALADITFYYLRNDGYLYKARYPAYNGAQSSFYADASGIVKIGECEAAYRSILLRTVVNNGNNTQGEIEGYDISNVNCGGRFRIYLSQPDPTMPATATNFANNRTTWLYAGDPQPTEIKNISFTTNNTLGAPFAGEISFEIKNYIGNVEVKVVAGDVAGNPNIFDDPSAVSMQKLVADDGITTVNFDGKNSSGSAITSNKISVRVFADRKGEIHMPNNDVESRLGGISVERLNGSSVNRNHIMWDDTFLVKEVWDSTLLAFVPARVTITSPLKALAGDSLYPPVDSSLVSGVGVHGWGCPKFPAPQTSCDFDLTIPPGWDEEVDGIYDIHRKESWGDNRAINDWTWDLGSPVEKTAVFDLPLPELTIQKSLSATTLLSSKTMRVGESGDIFLTVKNNGDYWTTGDIVVRDTIPTNLQINGAPTITGGTCGVSGQVVTCTSSKNIASDNTDSVVVTINVTPTLPGTYNNTGDVYGGSDITTSSTNRRASNQVIITAIEPTLVITKTVSSDIVRVGHPFTYTLTVRNTGTADTAGTITIRDPLDSSFTNVSASISPSSGGSCSVTSGIVSCASNAILQPNVTGSTIVVTITATPTTTSPNIYNTAYVTGGDDRKCPSGSTACSSSKEIGTRKPHLVITKIASSDPIRQGHQFTYTLTVTNTGSIDTEGTITIRDPIPSTLTAVSASINPSAGGSCSIASNTVTCTSNYVVKPQSVDSNSKITVTITVRANVSMDGISNTAYVTGGDEGLFPNCPVSGAGNCLSTVITRVVTPELHLLKTMNSGVADAEDHFVVGHWGEYILTVSNQGNIATEGLITVTDTIPSSFTVGTLPAGCTASGQTVTCTTTQAISAGGGEWIVRIPVLPNVVSDEQTNRAVTWGGDDQTCTDLASAKLNPRCESSITTDQKHAELTVKKEITTKRSLGQSGGGAGQIPIVLLGEVYSYKITVTNIGTYRTTANSYAVDYLPDMIAVDEASLPAGCWYTKTDSTVTCLIPAGFEKGASVSFEILVRSRAIDGSITNTVVVNGNDLECTSQNAAWQVARCKDTTTALALAPKIVVDKSAAANVVTQNGEIIYYLTVSNQGNYSTVSGYQLVDHLPNQTKFVKAEIINNAGLDVACGNNGNLLICFVSTGLKVGDEVRIAVTAQAMMIGDDINNLVNIIGQCDDNDECDPEVICVAEEERWLSNNEEFNDAVRCSSNTTVTIKRPPVIIPPPAGIVITAVASVVVVMLLLSLSLWVLPRSRAAKQPSSSSS